MEELSPLHVDHNIWTKLVPKSALRDGSAAPKYSDRNDDHHLNDTTFSIITPCKRYLHKQRTFVLFANVISLTTNETPMNSATTDISHADGGFLQAWWALKLATLFAIQPLVLKPVPSYLLPTFTASCMR